MGGVMSCCVAQVGCCAAGQAGRLCCAIGNGCCGRSRTARLANLLLFLVYVGAMLFAGSAANPWRDYLAAGTADGRVCDAACQQHYLSYRLGIGLVAYHLLAAALLAGVESTADRRAAIQESFWPLKVVLLAGLAYGATFLSRRAIDLCYYPAVAACLLFLLLQAVLLIDFAYTVAALLLDAAEDGSECSRRTLIGSTLALAAATLAALAALPFFFVARLERALVGGAALLALAMAICSVLPAVQEGNPGSGLFQSSFVALYSTLLVASAFIADAAGGGGGSATPMGELLVTNFMAIVSYGMVIYNALTSSNSMTRVDGRTDGGAAAKGASLPALLESAAAATASQLVEEEDAEAAADNAIAGAYDYAAFHLVLALAAIYTILLVTDWAKGGPAATAGGLRALPRIALTFTSASYWVRIASSWLTSALYLWTLFAPIILEDRAF